MDIRVITPAFSALTRQMTVEDVAAAAAAGYVRIINNRPDAETSQADRGEAIAAACAAVGIDYVAIPCQPGRITSEMIAAEAEAIDAPGPVLGYCRSGTRAAMLWALAEAGQRPTDEILAATRAVGYDFSHLREMIEAVAAMRGQPG